MDTMMCCVCHKRLGNDAPHLGNRAYCPEHWAKLSHNRGSVWRSGVIYVIAIALFALAAALVLTSVQLQLSQTGLVLAGVTLALVPAALWLAFFYVQDRLEPEPRGHVLGVFVLGALVAAAVSIPVLQNLFHAQDRLGQSLLVDLLVSILIVGFVQEFLKYAAVRYSVYNSAEFDERLDGVLYGTAAGLGFATALNIHYVVASGGVNLPIAAIQVTVTALAQASFAGVTGYFLGRAKFEEEPVWWLAAGLTLAATLNGVFHVLLGNLVRSGSALAGRTVNPWLGLALATLLAAASLAVILGLMRRASRLTLAGMDMV